MPVYEYQCSNGHNSVITEPINSDHKVPEKCEQCGEDLVRIFGSPTIRFNGTGWGKD